MSRFRSLVLIPTLTVLCVLLYTFSPAMASDETLDDLDSLAEIGEDISDAPELEDPREKRRDWAISLGYLVGVSPEYEGSSKYKSSHGGPSIKIVWKDRIFFNTKTLGANLLRSKRLKAGVLGTFESGRDEDDDDHLEGLGDIDSTIEVGGFVEYRPKPYRFRLEVRHDPGNGHEGTIAEAGAGFNIPFSKKPIMLVMFHTAWGSSDYMESYFGVDAEQSADSGLRTYDTSAGFKYVGIKLSSGYKLAKKWKLGYEVRYDRLVGDAGDSPVTTNKDQFYAGLGLFYQIYWPEDTVEPL